MMKKFKTIAAALLTVLAISFFGVGQKRVVSICTQKSFAAIQQLPKLAYDCPEGLIDSDDKILKSPARIEALKAVRKELESLTDPAWWQANIDELSACDLHGKPGLLTAEEKQKLKDGDNPYLFVGNHEIRLVITSDPCYQAGYSGSVLFLLYRKGGKVFVTQLRDGYYSRIDNSVGLDFADLNGQRLIELSTANNMPPTTTNYYYTIDPKTNQAVPKKIFKEGRKLTNEMSSARVIGELSELGLPRNAIEMTIIRRNHLLPTFSTYAEEYSGEDNGRRILRTVFRWNGRYYATRAVGR